MHKNKSETLEKRFSSSQGFSKQMVNSWVLSSTQKDSTSLYQKKKELEKLEKPATFMSGTQSSKNRVESGKYRRERGEDEESVKGS